MITSFPQTKSSSDNKFQISAPKILKTSSVNKISDSELQETIELIDRNGAVILECEKSDRPQENLLALKAIFGNVQRHKHSGRDGIVSVTPSLNQDRYVNTTRAKLALHTDGTFELNPPVIIALQCVVAAKTGGENILVDGKAIYDYLSRLAPEQLDILFEPDVLTVKRDDRVATHAIFTKTENGKVSIAFRVDKAVEISVKPEAIPLLETIEQFVESPSNQTIFKLEQHQILLLDNQRMLHGRNAFAEAEFRLLNRIWFDGKSKYQLKLGFTPNQLY
jgi:alpha-ketoglutarate-dependent taurine dioxygenase